MNNRKTGTFPWRITFIEKRRNLSALVTSSLQRFLLPDSITNARCPWSKKKIKVSFWSIAFLENTRTFPLHECDTDLRAKYISRRVPCCWVSEVRMFQMGFRFMQRVTMNTTTFSYVTPCNTVQVRRCFVGINSFRNVGKLLQHYKASHPRDLLCTHRTNSEQARWENWRISDERTTRGYQTRTPISWNITQNRFSSQVPIHEVISNHRINQTQRPRLNSQTAVRIPEAFQYNSVADKYPIFCSITTATDVQTPPTQTSNM
jgi:hypothetical protein